MSLNNLIRLYNYIIKNDNDFSKYTPVSEDLLKDNFQEIFKLNMVKINTLKDESFYSDKIKGPNDNGPNNIIAELYNQLSASVKKYRAITGKPRKIAIAKQ